MLVALALAALFCCCGPSSTCALCSADRRPQNQNQNDPRLATPESSSLLQLSSLLARRSRSSQLTDAPRRPRVTGC